MSKGTPTKTQVWLRDLSWLGGPEGAAIIALLLAVPFVIGRIIQLIRD